MTRSKSFPMQCVKSANGKSRSWVILMQKNVLSDNAEDLNKTPDIVKLRHPRTGTAAMFFFSSNNGTVQEVFSFTGKKKSWFLSDSVKEDGRLYLSTPLDPSFLVLPYLIKAKEEGKVIPLDDLLVDGAFPEAYRLLKCSAIKSIHLLADKKGDDDLNAWSYNEEKVLDWLCRKTKRVSEILEEKKILVRDAVSENFVPSGKGDLEKASGEDPYLSYACGLVAEYLMDDLGAKLFSRLNISEESLKQFNKRKLCEGDVQGEAKKMKKDTQGNTSASENQSKSLSSKEKQSKEKSKMKMGVGSQLITSFFKKN